MLTFILLNSVKFIGGPPFAHIYGFKYFETIILNILGGMLGVFAVSAISTYVVKAWNWVIHLFDKNSGDKDSYYAQPTSDMSGDLHFKYTYVPAQQQQRKQVFTPKSRRIVSIWLRYGLFGIAFVTPVLLSIPAGAFIACRLEKDRKKVYLGMLISISFWAFIITSIMFKVIPKPI